jgi:hypothetical protein
MAAFRKSGNNCRRVEQGPGHQNKIADTLQIVFLKKQIRKIGSGSKHISQNRQDDQNFHLSAWGGSGFRGSKVKGSQRSAQPPAKKMAGQTEEETL